VRGNVVKVEILKRDLTQKELARRLGVSLPQISMVVNGKRTTRWIQQAIAEELGMDVEDLFSAETKLSPDTAR
jgi:transcriptional regulator with XRE-family HTH domain